MMMVKIVAKKLTVLVQEVRIVSNDCEDSAITMYKTHRERKSKAKGMLKNLVIG